VVKDKLKALKEHLEKIKRPSATQNGNRPSVGSGQQDVQSDGKKEEEAPSAEETEHSNEMLADEDWLSETLEEVRVDPKHWPFQLPQTVAGRLARDAKEY
jgi:hypothetical protein